MTKFTDDFEWQKQFGPDVCKILGPLLLKPASWFVDVKQAGDLVVLDTGVNRTVAMRLRRPGYFNQFGLDFTIRWKRDSGAETEFSKIKKGYGDWFFYGHIEEGPSS